MRPLPIDQDRSEDLMSLCELGREKLESVHLALSQTNAKFLRLEHFSSFLSKVLNENNAVEVSAWAVQLRRIADRRQNSVDEVLTALVEGLEEYGWSAADIAKLKDILPPLRKIITSSNVELVIKSSDLYYLHTYHMHDARIVTDIRPVLSDNRSEIEAAIVKNLFVIRYSDGLEEDKNLEIVLSYEEMKRIRSEFDRALAKTEVIKKLVSEKLNVPTMVYGAES